MNESCRPEQLCPGALILRYQDLTEQHARGRALLTRINIGFLLLYLALSVLFGEGDPQMTTFYFRKYFQTFVLGACVLGILQLASWYWVGTSPFWYCLFEDRLQFHRPPESEDVPFEDIRELQRVVVPPGHFNFGDDVSSENRFVIILTLHNGREIRLIGYVNLSEGWEFLASRLSQKIAAAGGPPKEPFALGGKRVATLFAIGFAWFVGVYLLLPENLAVVACFLGLGFMPVPWLVRFHRYGRPPSEKDGALLCLFWILFCLSAVLYYPFSGS